MSKFQTKKLTELPIDSIISEDDIFLVNQRGVSCQTTLRDIVTSQTFRQLARLEEIDEEKNDIILDQFNYSQAAYGIYVRASDGINGFKVTVEYNFYANQNTVGSEVDFFEDCAELAQTNIPGTTYEIDTANQKMVVTCSRDLSISADRANDADFILKFLGETKSYSYTGEDRYTYSVVITLDNNLSDAQGSFDVVNIGSPYKGNFMERITINNGRYVKNKKCIILPSDRIKEISADELVVEGVERFFPRLRVLRGHRSPYYKPQFEKLTMLDRIELPMSQIVSFKTGITSTIVPLQVVLDDCQLLTNVDLSVVGDEIMRVSLAGCVSLTNMVLPDIADKVTPYPIEHFTLTGRPTGLSYSVAVTPCVDYPMGLNGLNATMSPGYEIAELTLGDVRDGNLDIRARVKKTLCLDNCNAEMVSLPTTEFGELSTLSITNCSRVTDLVFKQDSTEYTMETSSLTLNNLPQLRNIKYSSDIGDSTLPVEKHSVTIIQCPMFDDDITCGDLCIIDTCGVKNLTVKSTPDVETGHIVVKNCTELETVHWVDSAEAPTNVIKNVSLRNCPNMKWTGSFKKSGTYIDFRNLDSYDDTMNYVTADWLKELVADFNVYDYGLPDDLDMSDPDTMGLIFATVWDSNANNGIYFRVAGTPAQNMVLDDATMNYFLIRGIMINRNS